MVNGRIVESGDASLVDDINANGFERFVKAAPSHTDVPETAQPAHFDAEAALAHMEAALAAADVGEAGV